MGYHFRSREFDQGGFGSPGGPALRTTASGASHYANLAPRERIMSKVCSHATPRKSQASGILTFFLLLPGVSYVTTIAPSEAAVPTRKGSAVPMKSLIVCSLYPSSRAQM